MKRNNYLTSKEKMENVVLHCNHTNTCTMKKQNEKELQHLHKKHHRKNLQKNKYTHNYKNYKNKNQKNQKNQEKAPTKIGLNMRSKNHRQYLCGCKHKTNLQNYIQKIELEETHKKTHE